MSYLNTSPLVWGLLHGPERGVFDLRFELPAECAASLESGTADLGLVPVIEVARQELRSVPGLGIASDGPVRSILLVSKVPANRIRSIAMDDSSRTSVALTRIILAEKYHVRPLEIRRHPSVGAMLVGADAALIIGDPALRYDPASSPYYVYDLGLEWQQLTGLPMVYAVWAGRFPTDAQSILEKSYEFGRDRLEDIIAKEAVPRGFGKELAREYLSRHIVYRLGARHEEGMARFLELARKPG